MIPFSKEGNEPAPLPYFDALLAALGRDSAGLAAAFGRHVHWGYWPTPRSADGSVADFALASERLCRLVCDSGGVRSGLRVLDVGCGFGGTIASLNERFSSVRLTGLNIDERQLERARRFVAPESGNTIEFRLGDACKMPFEDASFDVVLALECAFHFESRDRFFSEARRVLSPGGGLALCDFVPAPSLAPFVRVSDFVFQKYTRQFSGRADVHCTLEKYRELGRKHGFTLVYEEDITENTVPTYPVLRRLLPELGASARTARVGAMALELAARLTLLRYQVLAFELPVLAPKL